MVIPHHLDPWQAVAQRRSFHGCLPIADCERLRPQLANTQGVVHYQLAFTVDQQGYAVIHGAVETVLQLLCQRCLEIMAFPIIAPLNIALVQGFEDMARLPADYDPWLADADDPVLTPLTLLEDELLLAIPAIPRHPDGQCVIPSTPSPSANSAEQPHPFALLATLKKPN
jgi:uncharacterized protein